VHQQETGYLYSETTDEVPGRWCGSTSAAPLRGDYWGRGTAPRLSPARKPREVAAGTRAAVRFSARLLA
jgi:hypothetical protein